MLIIEQKRLEKRMSQIALSRLSGVKQSVISDIESGKTRNPGIGTVLSIAKALGCSLNDLVVKEDEGKESETA